MKRACLYQTSKRDIIRHAAFHTTLNEKKCDSMKNIHLLLALLLLPTGAFAQSIIYSYDAAGKNGYLECKYHN